MTKHEAADTIDDESWIQGLGQADEALDTPRHKFYGRHSVRDTETPDDASVEAIAGQGVDGGPLGADGGTDAETSPAVAVHDDDWYAALGAGQAPAGDAGHVESDQVAQVESTEVEPTEVESAQVEAGETESDQVSQVAAADAGVSESDHAVQVESAESDHLEKDHAESSKADGVESTEAGVSESDHAAQVESAEAGQTDSTESDQTDQVDAASESPSATETTELAELSAHGTSRAKRLRKPLLIGVATAVCLATVGTGTAVAMTKDVSIVVDGQTQHVHTMAGTVAGALAAAGLSPSAHDTLAPTGATSISNGSTIVLDRGRQLTLDVDGKQRVLWTTARTVDQALSDLGVVGAGGSGLQLSANRSREIPLGGLAVTAMTQRTVAVTVGGTATVSAQTTATTVGALLAEQGISLGPLDRVTPGLNSALVNGGTVSVDRVQTSTVTQQVAVAPPADSKVNDATLTQGTTKVVQVRTAGSQTVTYQVTTVNGKQTAKKETGRATVIAAKAAIIHVGTKAVTPTAVLSPSVTTAADPAAYYADPAHWSVNWNAIAHCESTDNWAINTGNGYYGGLQFNYTTWLGAGGGQYAQRADLATKAQQIAIAEKVYAARGLEPWQCGWAARA